MHGEKLFIEVLSMKTMTAVYCWSGTRFNRIKKLKNYLYAANSNIVKNITIENFIFRFQENSGKRQNKPRQQQQTN